MIPRLRLSNRNYRHVFDILKTWALNLHGSRIVRVSAVQALYDIVQVMPEFRHELEETFRQMENETAPSIRARVSKLNKELFFNHNKTKTKTKIT